MRRLSLWITALTLVTTTTAIAQRTAPTNKLELERFSVAAAKDYKANRAKALELAKKHGWVIEKTSSDGRHISLQGIDSKGMPIYYITDNNSRAAATVGTDQVWVGGSLGLALSGASSAVGDKLAIWDGGRVRTSHQELNSRVVQQDGATTVSDHATHVAGTMAASGVNLLAKGMAYQTKKLYAYDFSNDVSEMAAAAKNLLVSNHSYGSISGWRYNPDRKGGTTDPYWEWWGNPDISTFEDYKFGYYDNSAAQWDKIAYDAPYYLMVKSSGNNRSENGPAPGQPYFRRSRTGSFELIAARGNISNNNGYDIISTYGTAKNVLTVGAVEPISNGYQQTSDVKISSFSSWGPTDDGRIKPDIVGNGVNLLSSLGTSNNAYGVMSGTSMAAPNVSGSLLLLQEHYANTMNGSVMRSATLKGLVIHTADEAGIAAGPDYIHGWGLLNVGRAAMTITDSKRAGTPLYKHLIEERQLQQGETYNLDVVASGTGPLVVTIAWTDPEATPIELATIALNNRAPRLVNDLDVRIFHDGTTYQPWTLNPAAPTAAATPGDNILDNVEQILIANPAPGETYKISVRHKGTLSKGPQAYSILASGVGGAIYCTSAPTSEQGSRIESVAIDGTTISPAGTPGCTTYSNNTEAIFSIEAGQTRNIQIKPGTCTTNAAKIAKVFIDWNANGSFTDAGEEAAVSSVIDDNTTINAAVTAPTNITIGYKVRMRVVLSETTDATTIASCGTYSNGETQDYLVQLNKPAKDIAALSISTIDEVICATPSQIVSVRLRNNGSTIQSNIPVKVAVRKNGTEVTQLNTVYKGSINPSREGELTLPAFSTEAGATYELIAEAGLQGDVIPSNNQKAFILTVPGTESAPQVSIQRCGNDPNYSFTGTGNGSIYWYNSATDTNPVAIGNQFQFPADKVGTTMYAGINDLNVSVGYTKKSDLSYGDYNQFDPDVYVKAYAPVVLESARLYIGNAGKITFTVFDENDAAVSIRTIDATPTRSTPGPGPLPNDPADQGEVYYLGLKLPAAGNYTIAVDFESTTGATLFRNNKANVPYPMGVPNVFEITGNSASTESNTYYYYFYDLKVKALGCKSERIEVQVKGKNAIDQAVITRNGEVLTSNAATGNQWFLNGSPIPGATDQNYTPTESGKYSLIATVDGCVSKTSEVYNFVYKPGAAELNGKVIIARNPSSGIFILAAELVPTDVIRYEVYDILGKPLKTGLVEKHNGMYEGDIDLSANASGVYFMRIHYNDETFVQKLVLQR
ncbi:S8 family serine peptidase [Pontibacter sp. KCTC 32443]|uniref:S8 family serine peptidase n=1 Tax=Pontibacter TaxID=323449 RepID=UPI00164DDBEE|nr:MULTISPECIES: S8 family serine peptidase [Pontibacter]MBC5774397.1 S8 family serine peptidase [Pontibacter sp. KCTC 32443]